MVRSSPAPRTGISLQDSWAREEVPLKSLLLVSINSRCALGAAASHGRCLEFQSENPSTINCHAQASKAKT